MSINWQGMLRKVSEQRDARERELRAANKRINALELLEVDLARELAEMTHKWAVQHGRYKRLLVSGFDQMKRADILQEENERLLEEQADQIIRTAQNVADQRRCDWCGG